MSFKNVRAKVKHKFYKLRSGANVIDSSDQDLRWGYLSATTTNNEKF